MDFVENLWDNSGKFGVTDFWQLVEGVTGLGDLTQRRKGAKTLGFLEG